MSAPLTEEELYEHVAAFVTIVNGFRLVAEADAEQSKRRAAQLRELGRKLDALARMVEAG